MRIAFLTSRLFDAPRSGGEIASARLIAALRAAGHELVCLGHADHRLRDESAIVLGRQQRPFDELGRGAQLAAVGAALLQGHACTVQRTLAGGMQRRAALALDALRGERLDMIVVDHLKTFALLRGQRTLPPLLLAMHNVESDGYLRRARRVTTGGAAGAVFRYVLRREAQCLRALELQALQASAAVACLSADDARRLREILRGAARQPAIEVLPGFPLAIEPVRPAPARSDGLRRIGLIGTWTWGPNRDALRWVLNEVLPQLPTHGRLVLAGTGLEGWTLPPRVRSLGRVAEARELYDAVDVVAVPSLHGTGVQEKAIEATASGRPVVATPHALRGLGPALPLHVHAAEGAAHFAGLCATVPLAFDTRAAIEAWAAARCQRYAAALARCLQATQRARPESVGPAHQRRQQAQRA